MRRAPHSVENTFYSKRTRSIVRERIQEGEKSNAAPVARMIVIHTLMLMIVLHIRMFMIVIHTLMFMIVIHTLTAGK